MGKWTNFNKDSKGTSTNNKSHKKHVLIRILRNIVVQSYLFLQIHVMYDSGKNANSTIVKNYT